MEQSFPVGATSPAITSTGIFWTFQKVGGSTERQDALLAVFIQMKGFSMAAIAVIASWGSGRMRSTQACGSFSLQAFFLFIPSSFSCFLSTRLSSLLFIPHLWIFCKATREAFFELTPSPVAVTLGWCPPFLLKTPQVLASSEKWRSLGIVLPKCLWHFPCITSVYFLHWNDQSFYY